MPPVFSQIQTNVLPSVSAVAPIQSIESVNFDSASDNLTALSTGLNPGLGLTSRINRFTAVNNNGGCVSAVPHSGAGGTTYVVGDLVYVTQSGAVAGTFQVAAVASGVVTALTLLYRGTGYSTATGLATTTNSASGSGLQVDLTAGADSASLPHALAGMTVKVRNDAPTTSIVKAIPHSGNAGTGYKVGDIITISQSATATFTNGSAVIAATNAFAVGQAVQFSNSGGALPTNFAASTTYYVIATGLSTSQFEVSATPGGAAIAAGSAGTGTQSVLNTTATFVVAAITGGGSTGPVGSLSPVTAGSGYSTATAVATTGGTGSALEADITAGGNQLAVYPYTGDQIAGAGANVVYNLAYNTDSSFTCFSTGNWSL